MILKKQIVLLTKDNLLTQGIVENYINSHNYEILVQSHADIKNFPKIDLLISDITNSKFSIYSYKIKTLINLKTDENQFFSDEIMLLKPLSLNYLLKLIDKKLNNLGIFCAINTEMIYHENTSTLSSLTNLIKFTQKENEVFKYLLLSPNFNATKESLMKNIWQYHAESESLTLDTHLYKLKNKLPLGLLEVKNSICQLEIDNIN